LVTVPEPHANPERDPIAIGSERERKFRHASCPIPHAAGVVPWALSRTPVRRGGAGPHALCPVRLKVLTASVSTASPDRQRRDVRCKTSLLKA